MIFIKEKSKYDSLSKEEKKVVPSHNQLRHMQSSLQSSGNVDNYINLLSIL